MGAPGTRRPSPQRLRDLVREYLERRFRGKPPAPDDPYANKLAPVRPGPSGRGGAAVAEPEEDSYRFFLPRSR